MPWVAKLLPPSEREFGPAQLETTLANPLLPPGSQHVWMSHGDRIEIPPAGFVPLASSDNSPFCAMGDLGRAYFGVQFHPEVRHTPAGSEILRRFIIDICQAQPDWTPASIIASSVEHIRSQVGGSKVLSAVSGGVDSSVATALVQRAIGDQLVAVFVDTGLLRQGEAAQVVSVFQKKPGRRAGPRERGRSSSWTALQGITEPEEKRRIIGELFIRIFEQQARQLGSACVSWCKAQFIPMWSNPALLTALRRRASRPTTM